MQRVGPKGVIVMTDGLIPHGAGTRTAEALRMPIHFSPLFVPLGVVTGMRPGRSYVQLEPEELLVVMGWAFRARIPREAIGRVAPAWLSLLAGVGVHGGRGTWVVNGSMKRLVEVDLSEPVPVRVLGFRAKLRRLYVSVKDPMALIAALSPSQP